MSGLVSDGVLSHTPERIAIVFGSERISYAELARRIRNVASRVDAARARRVAISLTNHPALLEIFFGATLAGAAVMLCEPTWPRATFDAMIRAHAPQIIFTEPPDVESTPQTLLAQPTPDMPFLIGFTSGTTGTPKAFIRSHASWIESFASSRIELGTSEATTVLLPGPLSHGLSLYAAVETLNAGGCIYIESSFDAARMTALAAEVNTIVAAPTLLDLMLGVSAKPLDNITRIVTAGAKLSPALRQRLRAAFPRARILEYYGASELSFVTIADEHCPPESVGRAFHGVDLRVDAAGVVWVKSNMVSAGYVGATDGSGFRMQDGWATVGDRGRLDARGFLTLIGREGDMIVTGGLNVYPSEVEAVIAGVPGVTDVLVTGEADARWGQIVTATIAGDAPLDALKEACIEKLSPHKAPRRWFRVPAFARTVSGKIDRTVALQRTELT